MTKPKILVIDIETAPLVSFTWGTWDQNVGLKQIAEEWSILSYAAKWLGSSKILYGDTSGRGSRFIRDDKAITEQIRQLLDEADIVIAQNGKKFDMRKINARMIMHGMLPPSPYRVIDTLLESRKYFAFTSHKLGWTSKHLTDSPKDEHKNFPDFDLWLECLQDNPKAWTEMKKYNIRDIKATEKVYLKLRPWITNHPNVTIYDDIAKAGCPNCGSHRLKSDGLRHTQATTYRRYLCLACGARPRGKVMLLPLAVRRAKLVGQGTA